MVTKIQKWGNSHGLRLNKVLLSDAGLEEGDEVDVVVRDGALIVTPVRRVRGRCDLRELVRRIPKESRQRELDWGPPRGRESW